MKNRRGGEEKPKKKKNNLEGKKIKNKNQAHVIHSYI